MILHSVLKIGVKDKNIEKLFKVGVGPTLLSLLISAF